MLDFVPTRGSDGNTAATPRSCDLGPTKLIPTRENFARVAFRIKVQQQPLKLLEILLRHPGEVVTREELRALHMAG